MTNIPFFKPTVEEEGVELVNEVLSLETSTNMVEQLEEKTSKYFNSKYAISTNSATSALHLSLCAMDLKRGDKIICSVNSFPTVAEVVRHFDAEPIFVDIDKDDFNMDPRQFERILRMHNHKKLKGAFVGHVAGQAADVDAINKIAKEYNVAILDDATNAFGTTYKKNKIGSTGSLLSCFSFVNQGKNTIANGGIMVVNDEEIASRANLLRNHAIKSESWDEHGNLGYIYDVVDVGLKYDMSEIAAAFNIAQLNNIDKYTKRRQEIAAIYDRELADCPHISIPIKKRDHIYSQYIIKIDKNRDSFARELMEKGIYTGLHFVPLHLLSYYKAKYSLKVNDYPTALLNYQQILSIPIYNGMTDEMVMYVCDAIKSIAVKRV